LAQIPPAIQSDRLLHALSECQNQMNVWLSKSPANVCLFMEDPLAAMMAANPDMDFDVMLELEAVLSGLARKLDLDRSLRPETTHA
jgi:hypothetical protein